jgi:UDP-N-acetyl-D-galactosamine dehydrogenase
LHEDLVFGINFKVSDEVSSLRNAKYFIITVPTPIRENNQPNFDFLIEASRIVGSALKPDDIVIYESTVYPGATEEICIPVLEKESKLKFNGDFYVGYSPERLSPGDKEHKLENTVKIVSGSTPETVKKIKKLYEEIITAGVYIAPSIKVAEAAKVIENTQRDLNIALINYLSKLFHTLGIDTHDTLEAAGTKWNFQKFTPGLVGGHCIGVDPYYLAHKSQIVNHSPDLILSARNTNNSMSEYIAKRLGTLILSKDIELKGSSCLVLGLTFKENCPDLRNSGSHKLILELEKMGLTIRVCDPWVNPIEAKMTYDLDIISLDEVENEKFDSLVLAVGHHQFGNLLQYFTKIKDETIIFDLKGFLPRHIITERL